MKEYIRATHNFDNITREWVCRAEKGQDKHDVWTWELSNEIRKKLGQPLYSFGVHALESNYWKPINSIVQDTIGMYLGGTVDHSIETKFREFIANTPNHKEIIKEHILKELELLIESDQVRVRET